jgi:hypothetical protein
MLYKLCAIIVIVGGHVCTDELTILGEKDAEIILAHLCFELKEAKASIFTISSQYNIHVS